MNQAYPKIAHLDKKDTLQKAFSFLGVHKFLLKRASLAQAGSSGVAIEASSLVVESPANFASLMIVIPYRRLYVGDPLSFCIKRYERYWFPCLNCQKRVAHLYLPSGAERFACRHYDDLTYKSTQTENKWRRLFKLLD